MAMIDRSAGGEERESPFFRRHEGFARGWEQFAASRGLTIDGTYNAYAVHAEVTGELDGEPIEFRGRRQLTSVESMLIPLRARYQQSTTIKLPAGATQPFSIRRHRWWTFLIGYRRMERGAFYVASGTPPASWRASSRLARLSARGVERVQSDGRTVALTVRSFPETAEDLEALCLAATGPAAPPDA